MQIYIRVEDYEVLIQTCLMSTNIFECVSRTLSLLALYSVVLPICIRGEAWAICRRVGMESLQGCLIMEI